MSALDYIYKLSDMADRGQVTFGLGEICHS